MFGREQFDAIDAVAIAAMERLFGVRSTVEPYSPDGSDVYRMRLTGKADGITMILWPSLTRVDVKRAGDHAWVMKNVASVEVIPGTEVIFRPRDVAGHLFVATNGFVNMVIG